MATVARTAGSTKFGVDVTSLIIGTGSEIAPLYSDATLTIEQEAVDASTVIENDTVALGGIKSATLEISNIINDTNALAALKAAMSTAEIAVKVVHAASGVQYAGTGIVTSAEVRGSGKDIMSASCTIVSNGEWAATAGAATAATPRVQAAKVTTQRASDIVSVAVGTDDYVNLFNEVGVRVEVAVEEGNASMDTWRVRQAVSRTVTLDLGKIVEASLPWAAIVAAGTAVTCSIVLGTAEADSVSGLFLPTSGAWSAGGKGAQSERITLQNVGAILLDSL